MSLPNRISFIGEGAFRNTKLNGRLVIPASVTSIGKNAFSRTSFSEIVLEGNSIINKMNKSSWLNANVFDLSEYGFYNSNGSSPFKYAYIDRPINGTIHTDSVTFGPNIRYISEKMLSGVKNLDIPNTIDSIALGAFSNLLDLETISLPFIGCSRTPVPEAFESVDKAQYYWNDYFFGSIFGYKQTERSEIGDYYASYGTFYFKIRQFNIPENLKTIIFTGDTIDSWKWFPRKRITEKDNPYTFSNYWYYIDYVQDEERMKSIDLIIQSETLKGFKNDDYSSKSQTENYLKYWEVPADWAYEQYLKYGGTPSYSEYREYYHSNTAVDYAPLCYRMLKKADFSLVAELPKNLLACALKLESITLPFPGAGTISSYNCLGDIFGTKEGVEGMEKAVYTDESGNTTNYYVPSSLREVRIAEGCTRIPYSCFSNFSMLKKVVLPTTITGVSKMAFQNCYSMDTLKMKRALPPVAFEESFEGCSQFSCVLQVPIDSKKYYSVANGWKYFFFIEEESPITVDAIKNIESAGEIVGVTQYKPGETASFTAASHSGYQFSGWSLDGKNIVFSETEYSFEVENNTSIYAIFRPILNDNTVEIATTDGTATFTWNIVENATKYVVRIYLDENMTALFAEYEVESNGNITRRKVFGLSDEAVTVQIDDMPIGTYYYSVTGMNTEDHIISEFTGVFDIATGVSEVCATPVSYNFTTTGVILHDVNGRPINVYTMTGRLVYATTGTSSDVAITLSKGMYIVRAGNQESMKISIR